MSKSFIIFFIVVVADILLDFGKWAIGRYTEITPFISFVILIFGSCIIAVISNYVSSFKEVKKFISYLHHKNMCWTRKDMKSKHWDNMLCTDCSEFKIRIGKPNKCHISAKIFELCVEQCLILNVWECPKFKKTTRKNK